MQHVLNNLHADVKALLHLRRYGRGQYLLIAILLLTVCLFKPHLNLPNRVYDWLIVIDVTQSMNVRDYSVNENGISRLEFVKKNLRESLRSLPCGSRVSLAMFAERDSLVIVRPVEVCAHYSVLDQTISRLDWRMAWAADSFIAHGVFRAIEQAAKLGKSMRVLFITDGQQAPPANPKYMPTFEGKTGEVDGYILGAGQLTPSQIPKLDDRNEIAGYWTHEDIQQFGSFGMAETLSVLAMEQGQHDRNAGHGAGADILAGAHLSALDEPNLKKIAQQTGLQYLRLDKPQQLGDVLTNYHVATMRKADTDLRVWFSVPALILIVIYILSTFAGFGLNRSVKTIQLAVTTVVQQIKRLKKI